MAGEKSVRFEGFLESVNEAKAQDYTERADTNVSEAAQFDAMKEHVQWLYEGVEVQHSFLDENDQIFDCIPIEQQPSLKESSGPLPPEPPAAPSAEEHEEGERGVPVEPQLSAEGTDRLGNTMACPPGTIPVRRVTLEELSQYENLRDFFRKAPGGAGGHPLLLEAEQAAVVHKYAHAYQQVENIGGHSLLNVWQPNVGSQIFSLSQQWYVAGSPVQTVELGWQVYPGKYGNTFPCLFIYWTADGYQNTGCYNLDCTAFVQTNPVWMLGGTLKPVSTPGGEQFFIGLSAYLYQGNWWLYIRGASPEAALGYYPASLYGSGPLSRGAERIDYGGEVVNSTAWPPMGSGAFANQGWQHAAYQSEIFYIAPGGNSVWASLNPVQNSSNCFTIDLESSSGGPYFYFGGPGGSNCT